MTGIGYEQRATLLDHEVKRTGLTQGTLSIHTLHRMRVCCLVLGWQHKACLLLKHNGMRAHVVLGYKLAVSKLKHKRDMRLCIKFSTARNAQT